MYIILPFPRADFYFSSSFLSNLMRKFNVVVLGGKFSSLLLAHSSSIYYSWWRREVCPNLPFHEERFPWRLWSNDWRYFSLFCCCLFLSPSLSYLSRPFRVISSYRTSWWRIHRSKCPDFIRVPIFWPGPLESLKSWIPPELNNSRR